MSSSPYTCAGSLHTEDLPRIGSLLRRVEALMLDGGWRSLRQLSEACAGSEASVSARIRDLRKLGHLVQKHRRPTGTWLYRIDVDKQRRLF